MAICQSSVGSKAKISPKGGWQDPDEVEDQILWTLAELLEIYTWPSKGSFFLINSEEKPGWAPPRCVAKSASVAND